MSHMKDLVSKSKGMQRAKLKSFGAKSEDITDKAEAFMPKRAFGGRINKQFGGPLGALKDMGSVDGKPAKTSLARKPRGDEPSTTTVNITVAKPEPAAPPPVPPMALTPPPAPPTGPPPGPMAGLGAPPPGIGPPPPGMPPLRANGGRISNLGKYAHGGKVQKAAGGGVDMTAGACSGEGRLEKVELVKRHRRGD